MILPRGEKPLLSRALEIIAACQVSQGNRAAVYRSYGQWIESGRPAGGLALANVIYSHLDRLAAHLFSPTDLRFTIDYENHHPKEWMAKAAVVARVLSREWERTNTDMTFGEGVKESLSYGACILKQLISRNEDGSVELRGGRLIMPWHFGVENEGVNSLSDQEAIVETVYLNKDQVWRRVRHLPKAEELYKRALGSSSKEDSAPTSFMHQVLSTAVLDVSLQNATRPMPGGIVQLTNDPNNVVLGPDVAVDLFPMHEIWVKDENGDDWITIQVIPPDILLSPRENIRRCNLFCDDTLPYTLIQPNRVPGYFWGRSEVVDLLMLQDWLSTHLDDVKRITGLQIDKIIGFSGFDGLTDENYGQLRSAGYFNMPQGAQISDLTPKMPENAIALIGQILALMDRTSGFSGVMSGEGAPGVRAGVHADTLMRTGSPRLRDRSLLVERQCAAAGDVTLAALEAKQAKVYWTDPENEETDFLLNQLPDDRRVAVDSHSSSPIYHDDHQNLVAWGVKSQILDGEDAIEMLPFPNKDALVARYKQRQQAKQQFIQEHPEVITHPRAARRMG